MSKKKSTADYLAEAYKEAQKAANIDEVPVGAVVVQGNKIIARAYNLKESKNLATAHAEILALAKASKKIKSWRLNECEVYVTLEPCVMCMGALVQARVKKIYFGAKDLKGGAISLGFGIHNSRYLNHRFEASDLKSSECSEILRSFFRAKR